MCSVNKMIFVLLLIFVSSTDAVFRLNDSQYALMPPVFHLDPYEECNNDPEGIYCTVELTLVSDEPSELLTMIQEYSAYTHTHYNHTRLRHGICITQTCKKFYETKQDLRSTLEACANESLYNKYNLKAKLSDAFHCSKGKNSEISFIDLTVGGICVIILCANIVGSICHYSFIKGKFHRGTRLANCFSIFRNWEKLVASPREDGDPRLRGLRGLSGIRVLNIILVIIGHTYFIVFMSTKNPAYIEDMFMSKFYLIIMNGSIIMQTSLLISSFLLVYNWLIYSEKQKTTWRMLPKLFLMRWLRLTPSYAVVIALTATWFGRLTSGPYWKKFVFNEMSACRRDWWKHLLYINNYFNNSECMGHSWYLAADTQLYSLAAVIFVMCRTPRGRNRVLGLLFLAGVIMPAVHTYLQDLSGVLIVSPEIYLTMYVDDRTFNNVYKRGHTNLTGYVIGMIMAYIIYDWQTRRDHKNLQKYRYLLWVLLPLGCLCFYSGTVFYSDVPPPTYIHILYAAFLKPVFGILTGALIAGVIMQVEGVCRGVLEWSVWVTPSRLSYSAYLLHMAIIRNVVAMQTTTTTITIFGIVLLNIAILLTTFTASFVFWMLVEAPLSNLIQEYVVKTTKGGAQKRIKETEASKEDFEKETFAKSANKIIAKMQ